MCEICKLPTASLRALNRRPSFCPQSQRAPRDDLKLAVSKIRQDATEFSELQRKLVPARAREATATRRVGTANLTIARPHARQRRSVLPSFSLPPTSFPRRRESIAPNSQRNGRIAWSCRPLAVMPINRAEPPSRLGYGSTETPAPSCAGKRGSSFFYGRRGDFLGAIFTEWKSHLRLRVSPSRRVTRSLSRCSKKASAYLRLVPNISRTSLTAMGPLFSMRSTTASTIRR